MRGECEHTQIRNEEVGISVLTSSCTKLVKSPELGESQFAKLRDAVAAFFFFVGEVPRF